MLVVFQDEGGDYSTHDLKTLLQGVGLVGRVPCEALMAVHRALQTTRLATDRLTVVDLLQAGLLAVHQLQRGMDLQTALQQSCTDVYVRGQHNTVSKQVSRSMHGERSANESSIICVDLILYILCLHVHVLAIYCKLYLIYMINK